MENSGGSLLLTICIAILIAHLVANSNARKKLPEIYFLRQKLDAARNLQEYYMTRDHLLMILQKLAKYENFVSDKNRPVPKASQMPLMIYSNEEKNVARCIDDAYAKAYYSIRNNANINHTTFLAEFDNYLWRISPANKDRINYYSEELKKFKR